jgi:hypothetical protein
MQVKVARAGEAYLMRQRTDTWMSLDALPPLDNLTR